MYYQVLNFHCLLHVLDQNVKNQFVQVKIKIGNLKLTVAPQDSLISEGITSKKMSFQIPCFNQSNSMFNSCLCFVFQFDFFLIVISLEVYLWLSFQIFFLLKMNSQDFLIQIQRTGQWLPEGKGWGAGGKWVKESTVWFQMETKFLVVFTVQCVQK